MVFHYHGFWYESSNHIAWQMPYHSLDRCKQKAFHPCVSDNGSSDLPCSYTFYHSKRLGARVAVVMYVKVTYGEKVLPTIWLNAHIALYPCGKEYESQDFVSS